MEPSKAWDDDYDEDMMDIDTFGGNEDGDGDLLASIITVKGDSAGMTSIRAARLANRLIPLRCRERATGKLL